MNAIETLKAIKATISAAFAVEPVPAPAPEPTPAPVPEPQPVEMKEYALADGTKVMIDKLEVGGKVAIVDASGVEIVAADAEYNLADGSSIAVVGGLITEVKAPEVIEDVTTPQGMSSAIQKFAESTTPDIAKMAIILKAIFENVYGWEIRRAQEEAAKNQAIEIYKTGFEEHKKVTGESFNNIIGLFETLIDTPAVDPIQVPKTFAQIQGESKAEKFAAAAQALESFKQHKTK